MFLSIDLISFFDREGLQDCVDSLKEINVNNKAIRIWYQMNRDTTIKIKTPVGDTKERFVGDCVAQGTISAALVSANNLDRGLVKNFKDCENTVKYGNINILPLAYQDDIGDVVTNVMMIKEHAKRIDNLLAEKNLEAHKSKTGIAILGSKSYRDKCERDLNDNPVKIGTFEVKKLSKVDIWAKY